MPLTETSHARPRRVPQPGADSALVGSVNRTRQRPLRRALQAGRFGAPERAGRGVAARGRGRLAPRRPPHRRRRLREAHRHQGHLLDPHRVRHQAGQPLQAEHRRLGRRRTSRPHSTRASRSSRRPGRRTAPGSPTSRSRRASRWSTCTTLPAASARRWPNSAAATARRPGRRTAASWRSR